MSQCHKHKSIIRTPPNLTKNTFKAFSKASAKASAHAWSVIKLTKNTVYFKYYPYNCQKKRLKHHCKHAQYLLGVYESPEVIYPPMEHINKARPTRNKMQRLSTHKQERIILNQTYK